MNAGKSELYGFESEIDWQVSEQIGVFASIGFVHTEFKDFPIQNPRPGEPNNFAGNTFPHAPRWSIAAGADWQHPSGFFMSGRISYQSKSFSDSDNTIADELEARVLVNAQVGYEWEEYRLTLFASNLFNEKYFTNLNSNAGRIGDPRTYGVRVDAQF